MGFKEKILFVSGCWSCLIGLIILGIVFAGDNWQETSGNITTQYGAMSPRNIICNLTIHVGLQDVVIFMKGYLEEDYSEIEIKEVFSWRNAYMKDYLKNGLKHGLPYPILTILEYLNEDHGWGARMCFIGRLVSTGLWISLVFGLLSAIFVQIREKWFLSGCLGIIGVILIILCLVYNINLPNTPLVIHISGKSLIMVKGWPYYVTLSIGIICIIMSTLTSFILFIDTFEFPLHLFNKVYHHLSSLLRKQIPHLHAIT